MSEAVDDNFDRKQTADLAQVIGDVREIMSMIIAERDRRIDGLERDKAALIAALRKASSRPVPLCDTDVMKWLTG